GRSNFRRVQGHRQSADSAGPALAGKADFPDDRYPALLDAQGRTAAAARHAQSRVDTAQAADAAQRGRSDGIPDRQDGQDQDQRGIPRVDERLRGAGTERIAPQVVTDSDLVDDFLPAKSV